MKNKKRVIAVSCKAKDLLNEIQKQSNQIKQSKTNEEVNKAVEEKLQRYLNGEI